MLKLPLSIIIVTAAIHFFSSPAIAQTYSVDISPSIILFDKAQLKTQSLTIRNTSSEAVELIPQFYTITDTKALDGSVSVGNKDPKLSQLVTLSENKTKISSLRLDPLESRRIMLDYQIYKSSATDFFTILWEPKVAPNEAEIDDSITHVNPSIGTVILATNTASELNMPKVSWEPSKFQKSGPLSYDINLENSSRDLMIFTPRITIKNILNQEVGIVEFPTQYILPESKRSLRIEGKIPAWNDTLMLGPYTSSLVVIGANNQSHVLQSNRTYVLPILPIAISSFAIFFMVGVYLRVRKKSRR